MAERNPTFTSGANLPAFDEDYAAWLDSQLGALRERRLDALDLDHLIDEVGDLGTSNFKAFVSAIRVVLLHMLKWDYQPARRSNRNGWLSIDKHRDRIMYDLAESPSHRARIDEAIKHPYPSARRGASVETGPSLRTFPELCP